ncbi:hypothetical protein IV203_008820 [Nitzschia inconspicua]|uniref:Uncharacterized protein n=1 Tax=Nitzschia inconspicua TaxID=303405 RepID=A0A9K3KZQ9_9STRA|nr:hypothetical protein IV203_008820 [Nitzschia inconspicua]
MRVSSSDKFAFFLLPLLHFSSTCQGQSAFTRQEACSQDASVMGYTTLENINADMADEVGRIAAGGDPAAEYTLILCPPSGTFLDPRQSNDLKPILNNLSILCLEGAECILNESQVQLSIGNSQVENYPLTTILVRGLTFQRFSGTAISFQANQPTEFTCENCIFQGFTNARVVVDIFSPTPSGDPAGAVKINNGIIRATNDSGNQTTTFAFFDNAGGFLRVNGLEISNTSPQGPIFYNRNGDTTVANLVVQLSTLESNIVNNEQGPMRFDNARITGNIINNNAFFATGRRAPLTLNGLVFTENSSSTPWSAVVIQDGGSARITGMQFISNTNVQSAVSSQGPEGTTIEVVDSVYRSNRGTGQPDDFSNAMLTSIGSIQGTPNLRVRRVEFDQNQNVAAEISAQSGNVDISEACFQNGSATQVVYSDGSGNTAADTTTNFVDIATYTLSGSQCTTEEDGLLFVEGSSCLPLASSDVCVRQLDDPEGESETPTEAPSLIPTSIDSSVPPTGVDSPIAPIAMDDSDAPTGINDSAAPTTVDSSVAPTGVDDSAAPTSRVEVEISVNPTGEVSSSPPSVSLEPSFLPTKPPTYRVDCTYGDDDDDHDNGKGKGFRHGKRGKSGSTCRKNGLKRKKPGKLFGNIISGKSDKFTKQDDHIIDRKSNKSRKSDTSYGNNGNNNIGNSSSRLVPGNLLQGPPKSVIRSP